MNSITYKETRELKDSDIILTSNGFYIVELIYDNVVYLNKNIAIDRKANYYFAVVNKSRLIKDNSDENEKRKCL